MKKILSLISAAAVILCLSSCGSEEKKPEKESSGGKVTQVIYGNDAPEEGDTSAEAIEFLKEYHPFFYENYFAIRSQAPLTFVSSVTEGENDPVTTSIYVKDEDTMAIVGFDALGRSVRVLYDGKTGYQIYDDEKKIYSQEYGEEIVKSSVESGLAKVKYSSVSESDYNSYAKEYNGKKYLCYSISSVSPFTGQTISTEYLFETETSKVKYVLSGTASSEVIELSNTISDESVFEIPTGYTEGTIEELNNEIMEALGQNQTAQ